jgi:hypothetical protein
MDPGVVILSASGPQTSITPVNMLTANYNHARWRDGLRGGHYESFWLRANHPSRPLAFWIRYTLFSPKHQPENAIGELWCIWSDGEAQRLTAVKREVPMRDCRFAPDRFMVSVADARLHANALSGWAEAHGNRIEWELQYSGGELPLFHLPQKLYDKALPKAKSLVGLPLAVFNGQLRVNGEVMRIENWVGSQNHNWGSKHTDHYAYGQVAGFDSAPQSFLEIATARIKLGPLWTPWMTPLVLRHDGREYALNALGRSLRNQGSFNYFDWHFAGEDAATRIEGRIHASREAFVGLRYYNPPGRDKCCLNSKIAACELALTDKRSGRMETLSTAHRAAFEILSDDFNSHGVAVRA